jgi:hypothetical protein
MRTSFYCIVCVLSCVLPHFTSPHTHRWRDRAKHIGEADQGRRALGKARLDNLYEKMLDDAKAELAEDVILERYAKSGHNM